MEIINLKRETFPDEILRWTVFFFFFCKHRIIVKLLLKFALPTTVSTTGTFVPYRNWYSSIHRIIAWEEDAQFCRDLYKRYVKNTIYSEFVRKDCAGISSCARKVLLFRMSPQIGGVLQECEKNRWFIYTNCMKSTSD